MPLKLPEGSRLGRKGQDKPLPQAAVSAFDDLIGRVASQGDRRAVLEHFKGYFSRAVGAPHIGSSNEGWAYTDLLSLMGGAAQTPALFLEAFYDACEELRLEDEESDFEMPDVDMINEVCREHDVPFQIRPPKLVRTSEPVRVARPKPAQTLAEQAREILQESMHRAEELLTENRPREAVGEMLWILESLATAFRGAPLPSGEVKGRYFNQIARELRAAVPGTTLARVIEWSEQLQGYLSSPTGGGVRHGLDLTKGTPISPEEGRLFYNLIQSYVSYLMAEHERLHAP